MDQTVPVTDRKRWLALYVICLGTLMIVLDSTIVNVALPSIRQSLGFSATTLAWVINAYMLTFGGFLLLGGRLGDLFGHRKMFLVGLVAFTIASLICGLSTTQLFLIGARAVQGLAGAIVSAVGLSLVMGLFPDDHERPKAMGFFSFVAAAGGSVGLLLGGILTSALNWHWIFLVNLPVGIVVYILSMMVLPKKDVTVVGGKLDVFGALTITLSLMLAVFAIVNGHDVGWMSFQTMGCLIAAVILFVVFILIEQKVQVPLLPLSLFRNRNITVSNIVGVLWSAGMFAWFFLSALYLQLILHYTPLQIGLAFLPSNIIMAAFSLGLSAKMVNRFGIKRSLTVGLSLVAVGLLLLSRAPVLGRFIFDVLPSMIFLGFGAGISFNPMLLAAMSDVGPEESGLASGVVNTAFMMGGALGLAILASVAASFTARALLGGKDMVYALTEGYHAAFLVGTLFVVLAAMTAGIFLVPKKQEALPTNPHI